MKTIDIAGIRNARLVACFSLRRHWRTCAAALAATLAVSMAGAGSSPTVAAPLAPALGSPSPQAETLLLQAGCQGGNAVMCNDLGVSYLHGRGVPADMALARFAFQRSCRQGSADGCGNLGALYESGAGVSASFAKAARLYERACTMGCALGCSNLGALYARGLGVARDRDEAQHLFALACETGSAAGCNNLLQLPPAL